MAGELPTLHVMAQSSTVLIRPRVSLAIPSSGQHSYLFLLQGSPQRGINWLAHYIAFYLDDPARSLLHIKICR